MNHFIKRMLFRKIIYSPKEIEAEDIGTLSANNINYILGYTNNITVFTIEDKNFYFKPSKIHSNKKTYIDNSIETFFDKIYDDDIFKQYVKERLSSARNRKKLFKMGDKSKKSSLNFYLRTGDASRIGLLNENFNPNALRKFIFYLYGDITAYKNNCGLKKGRRQTTNAVRALSVQKLCRDLSLHLVPATRYVKFYYQDVQYYGTFAEDGQGINICSLNPFERLKRIKPILLCALTNLNFLDVLVYDNDHRVNNFLTIADVNGNFVDICSHDNDGPSVFYPSPFINMKTKVKYSSLVKKGLINRPHMSKKLAEKIINCELWYVNEFKGLLTNLQIKCFKMRLKKIKKAIVRTIKENEDFLLEDDEWTEACIKEELSGKYGKTYLISFLTDCYYPSGEHPSNMCELYDTTMNDEEIIKRFKVEQKVLNILDDLPIILLNKMFELTSPMLRKIKFKEWINVLKQLIPSIHYKITFKAHQPYMTENGLICLSRRDFFNPQQLLIAVAHESAHMLLMMSENYELLKSSKNNSVSEIESAATALTIAILSRCNSIASNKTKKSIEFLISLLKTELPKSVSNSI